MLNRISYVCFAVAVALTLCTTACNRQSAEFKQIQQQRSGEVSIVLLNNTGVVKQQSSRYRLEFRNASTNEPANVSNVQIQSSMRMPGMGPMFGNVGTMQQVSPGVYEFDADPFGLHLYHCHTVPLKRHIHKGLYGTFIIDPRGGRPPADELVMMMNAFDSNFDSENEVYAVNTVANAYMAQPIKVTVGRLVRIYLVNITEFDLVNSFHLHGMFFDAYRPGTRITPSEHTDTITLCQGERAVLETTFRYPGDFMFHAHQSEFAELGWMGLFRAEGARRES